MVKFTQYHDYCGFTRKITCYRTTKILNEYKTLPVLNCLLCRNVMIWDCHTWKAIICLLKRHIFCQYIFRSHI